MADAKHRDRQGSIVVPHATGAWCAVRLLAVLLVPFTQILGAEARKPTPMPPIEPSLAISGPSEPTAAWSEFCKRLPSECDIDSTEASTIELDSRKWATLVAINQGVNAAIAPLSDLMHWGATDRWDYPDDGLGDCKDYQLLKRRLLVEAGFPRRALRMAVVLDEERAGHAVLMVRTDRGELILDNKRDDVLTWHRTGYIFLKREGDGGHAWASFGGQISPALANHIPKERKSS